MKDTTNLMFISRQEPVLHFVGEQDGTPERKLKSALSEVFAAMPTMHKAYLARVRYGDESTVNVALALVAGQESRASLVTIANKVFHSMFSIGQHLDVLFPSAQQEAELRSLCRPFFEATA